MKFLHQLQQRNRILYWFGWLNIIAALICIVMIQVSDTMVLGINAWIKPMKFYFSIAVFSWSMGWYLHHLANQKAVRRYSIMLVIVFIFEMIVITWQAANGRLSHFNTTNSLYSSLFSLMGVAITILAVWTLLIGIRFFRQQQFDAPMVYIWGIRLGIILFVIFSFEGGVMAAKLTHTIGGKDGGPGLPVINWSRIHGDLRVAHFFGMHALQLLPFLGYYVFRKPNQLIAFTFIYFAAVAALLIQAMRGIPLFS